MRNFAFAALPLLLVLLSIHTTLAPGVVTGSCFPLQDNLYCKAWTDKPFYSPGDTGKLTIDLKNINNYTVKVNNLTITFPWAAYINNQWDGNSTINLNTNVSSYLWMPEQTVSFTVPSDGRFPSSVSGGTVQFGYTSYCPSCDQGRSRLMTISFTIAPNSFLVSTGWQSMSNDILYTDIILAAMAVLFLFYIIWSRPKGAMMPRITSTT